MEEAFCFFLFRARSMTGLSPMRNFWQQGWQQGNLLIGLGLALIVAAQFWTALPVVTAIALIGRGALLTLQSRPRSARQDTLAVVNLSVYSTLVCLAIVAQSNAVLQDSLASISLGMLLDHAVAIVLLLGLVCRVFLRLSQPTG